MSKAGAQAQSPHEIRIPASRRIAGRKSVDDNLLAAFEAARAIGGEVQFTVEVAPTGETVASHLAVASACRRALVAERRKDPVCIG